MSRLEIQSSIDVKTILTANISNNFKTTKENEEKYKVSLQVNEFTSLQVYELLVLFSLRVHELKVQSSMFKVISYLIPSPLGR